MSETALEDATAHEDDTALGTAMPSPAEIPSGEAAAGQVGSAHAVGASSSPRATRPDGLNGGSAKATESDLLVPSAEKNDAVREAATVDLAGKKPSKRAAMKVWTLGRQFRAQESELATTGGKLKAAQSELLESCRRALEGEVKGAAMEIAGKVGADSLGLIADRLSHSDPAVRAEAERLLAQFEGLGA